MALPDRFEFVGVVVGSVLLVALPVSALGSALFGTALDPWVAMVLWLTPGLVLGVLVAGGRLPVTYHQVWSFSVSSYLLAFAGWGAAGVSFPAADRGLAVIVWVVALALGALVARARPAAVVRNRLRGARS